ncbi:hypothetical protein GPECTOR_74g679 [Gonium pectorale]|uniref:Protein kinase domain-containing protein n=1 Tax=Gonium pectorale TaxID=33097 RepID=A0A150G3I7_GONPE|nr:hypothetical protein GPECTOR_74g679 [Gonium pectorale]|eukprot:KXZ44065.1 hypothetical protein GPECTOR_74g679 [Gonium pectorale]
MPTPSEGGRVMLLLTGEPQSTEPTPAIPASAGSMSTGSTSADENSVDKETEATQRGYDTGAAELMVASEAAASAIALAAAALEPAAGPEAAAGEAEVLHIALQVARALAYLHPTILHRDLKPANVLVSEPDSATPVVKLADFGLSRLHNTVVITRNPAVGTCS